LRVVVDSASKPLVGYLGKLAATVACEIIPCRSVWRDLPEQIRADAAHFAVRIDGDGETCSVLDEQGREVHAERLLLWLAAAVGGDSSHRSVVLETGSSRTLIERFEGLGMRVAMSSPRRADLSAAMSETGALVGGGPSGRSWYSEAGFPSADALMSVTRLLVLLSRSDEPLSAVLDREAAWV
jgi:phosphomannomutase